MGLLAILLHSAVDFNMQIPANAILAVALMALLSGQLRFATERYWFRAGQATKWAATVVLLAGFGYLAGQEWRGAGEFFWFERAGRAPYGSHARIDALERAFAAEPMNAETSYAIGESYRAKSWEGNDQYVALGKTAMDWYQRGTKLDPYDSNNWLRYGMCQDWIGGAEDSGPAYGRANELDPNGYTTSANIGWHYVQTGDYAAARTWFQRSLELEWDKALNPLAHEYLPIVELRLKEAAAGQK
jgi:tetratricopeptide (TPR) repeat protein